MGSYKDSPFVTGSWSKNLETEILDYGAGEWVHYPDEFYPYTNGGDKYVYNKIHIKFDEPLLKAL